MCSERGQASVEWIGLVLLLALALTALARVAPLADADGLGAELLHAVTCAARGGCSGEDRPRAPGDARALVTVPPLVPVAPRGSRPGGTRPWLRFRVPRLAPLARRTGHRAGVLWRRSWMFCLGYERVRYGVLNPEIRFPRQTIPVSEGVRMANDCLSPVDLVRDWDLIRGRR